MQGFCHAVAVELADLSAFHRFRDEVASVTTDLGVESNIQSFKLASVFQCFPPWMRASLESSTFSLILGDDDEGEQHTSPYGMWDVPQSMLPYAVQIPGALHILHNIQQDLGSHLAHWSEHINKLKFFQPLLGELWYRERLVYTCLQGGYVFSFLWVPTSAMELCLNIHQGPPQL